MSQHKYHVGEKVVFVGSLRLSAALGEYEVVKRLPVEQGQVQYRLKSALEKHERVAGEEQLASRGH